MRKREALGGLGLFLLGAGPAGPPTATISVSATVAGKCGVSSPVVLGDPAPDGMASLQGPLMVNCSAGTVYAVSLNGGVRVTGDQVHMIGDDSASLPFEIYRDSGHRQRWGSAGAAQSGVGSGKAQALPLYAATRPIPARLGADVDVMIVTIAF